MPLIRRNRSFVGNRRIINDIEDFLEVFISTISYHRVLRFSAGLPQACDRRHRFCERQIAIIPSWQTEQAKEAAMATPTFVRNLMSRRLSDQKMERLGKIGHPLRDLSHLLTIDTPYIELSRPLAHDREAGLPRAASYRCRQICAPPQ